MDILDRLELGYQLVPLGEAPHSPRPVALIAPADATFSAVSSAVSALGPRAASALLFLHLPPGDGTDDKPDPIPRLAALRPRAACSGHLAPDGRLAVANSQIPYFGPQLLAAARFRIVEEGLLAMHTAVAAEGAGLCAALGVRGDLFCRAIGTAAGTSWVLRNLVPVMLQLGGGETAAPGQTFAEAQDALNKFLEAAGEKGVDTPMSTAAAGRFAAACDSGVDSTGSSAQVFTDKPPQHAPAKSAEMDVSLPAPIVPKRVGVIGLGAMGLGMANVLRASVDVVGYDVHAPAMEAFAAGGGTTASSPAACAEGADILILMVMTAAQASHVLFDEGAAQALARDAVVLLMITAAPSDATALAERLVEVRPDVRLVDAPVSGSTPRAASGDLTILASGLEACSPEAAGRAVYVLQKLACGRGNTHNLVSLPGVGSGMGVKMLNQHQAAAFLLCSAEALVLAQSLGLPLAETRRLLLRGPAQTWMMWHRGGNMLAGLRRPASAMVKILNKDIGIVMAEAQSVGAPVPMLQVVQGLFEQGMSNGWEDDDDSSLARLWLPCGIDLTKG